MQSSKYMTENDRNMKSSKQNAMGVWDKNSRNHWRTGTWKDYTTFASNPNPSYEFSSSVIIKENNYVKYVPSVNKTRLYKIEKTQSDGNYFIAVNEM